MGTALVMLVVYVGYFFIAYWDVWLVALGICAMLWYTHVGFVKANSELWVYWSSSGFWWRHRLLAELRMGAAIFLTWPLEMWLARRYAATYAPQEPQHTGPAADAQQPPAN